MNRAGFPIQTPGAWRSAEIDFVKDGLHVLSADDLREINAALVHLLSLGDLDLPDITPATFPLGTMGDFMRRLPGRLDAGRRQ